MNLPRKPRPEPHIISDRDMESTGLKAGPTRAATADVKNCGRFRLAVACAATLDAMQDKLIPIDEAARAVPCDVETLRKWLQQGHITGRDSFGRTDRRITDDSTGIVVSVESLKNYCVTIGVTPYFSRKS